MCIQKELKNLNLKVNLLVRVDISRILPQKFKFISLVVRKVQVWYEYFKECL